MPVTPTHQDFEFLLGGVISKLFPVLTLTIPYVGPQLSTGQVSTGAIKALILLLCSNVENASNGLV